MKCWPNEFKRPQIKHWLTRRGYIVYCNTRGPSPCDTFTQNHGIIKPWQRRGKTEGRWRYMYSLRCLFLILSGFFFFLWKIMLLRFFFIINISCSGGFIDEPDKSARSEIENYSSTRTDPIISASFRGQVSKVVFVAWNCIYLRASVQSMVKKINAS